MRGRSSLTSTNGASRGWATSRSGALTGVTLSVTTAEDAKALSRTNPETVFPWRAAALAICSRSGPESRDRDDLTRITGSSVDQASFTPHFA